MTSDKAPQRQNIAITGIALRLPEADDPETLRNNLKAGRDSVRELSAERRRRTSQPLDTPYQVTGYLDEVDMFDHAFFDIPRGQANLMAPEQRLLLQTAYQALESAGQAPGSLRGHRIGVYVGGTRIDYASLADEIEPPLLMGVHHSATAGRIARALGLTGPTAMIDSSCSSGLVAVQQAVNDLRLHETEMAIVSVVNVNLSGDPVAEDPLDLGIRSADGKTRAFSAMADGTGSGEAAISIVLRRLDDAIEHGDPVLAVLKGIAVNNVADRSSSLTAPDSRAEAEVIRLAWQRAGLDPATASYVEAHGTATRLGDPIEVEALGEVFGVSQRDTPIQISTIKSNIGHTWSASGLAGLAKVVLSLRYRELYPSLHVEQLSPLIDFRGAGVEVTRSYRRWTTDRGPRRAGVSSFGITGTGAHAVLEEATERTAATPRSADNKVWLPVSARTPTALTANLAALRTWLTEQQDPDLDAVQRTLLAGRDQHPFRAALVMADGSPTRWVDAEPSFWTAQERPQLALLLTSQPAPDATVVAAFRAESVEIDRRYLEAESAFDAAAVPVNSAFCLQYALLRWVAEIGLSPKHVISEGTGRVARDVAEGRSSLADGVRMTASTADSDSSVLELESRVDRLLGNFAGQQLCFLELGASSVIATAIAARKLKNLAIISAESGPAALLARLYCAGISWDWRADVGPGPRLTMPTYRFDRIRCWIHDPDLIGTPKVASAKTGGGRRADLSSPAVTVFPEGARTDEGSGPPSAEAPLPTASALDEVLAIWRDVMATTQISADDEFTSIGGDSISGLQIVGRLASRFDTDIDVLDLFELGTPRALAARLAEDLPPVETATVPVEKDAEATSIGNGDDSPALPPSTIVPASGAQQNIWLASQFEDGSVAFNLTRSFLLRGTIDDRALRQALNRLVERHVALCASFAMTEDGLVQHIAENVIAPDLADISLAGPCPPSPGSGAEAVSFAALPFDLACAPLLRAQRIRFGDGAQLLTLSTHHIVADGWSLGIIERDLMAFYESERMGKPAALPAMRDVAVPMQDSASSVERERRDSDREYWLDRFRSVPESLRLPAPLHEDVRFRGDYRHYELPTALWHRLKQVAKTVAATPFVVALSAMTAVLRGFSAHEELVLGTSLAGRDKPGAQDAVAMLVRTLPLRIHIDDHGGFTDLVEEVRSTFFDATRHSGYEYESLLGALKDNQLLQRPNLFDVLVEYQKFGLDETQPTTTIANGELSVTPVELTLETSVFPLNVMLGETDNTLGAAIRFDTNRFAADAIDAIWRSFAAVLDRVTTAPDTPLASIPFLAHEDALAVRAIGHRSHDFDFDLLIHRQIERLAATAPERIALRTMGDPESAITFAELNASANRLARLLVEERQIAPGDIVALAMDRSSTMVTAILAVWKCGAAYLPLDPTNPTEFQRSTLRSSGARLVLTEPEHLETVPRHEDDPAVIPLTPATALGQASDDLDLPFDRDGLAYVIYTSGSTGAPKGAMVEHRGMLNHLHAKILDLDLNSESVVAQTASNSFDISVWQMFAAPFVGGHTIVVAQAMQLDPVAFGRQIDLAALTVLEVVPSYLDAMLDAWHEEGAWPKFTALRQLIVTGEACAPTQVNRWFGRYPGTPVVNAYGPTEASDDVTHHAMSTTLEHADVPLGVPIPNTWITIVDSHLRQLPQGAIGEICVSGICVGRGYLNAPEQTAKAFVDDPLVPGQRMYRTGDQGFWDRHGKLHYLGREDSQVKVRGFRIGLDEIERRVLEAPGVRRAALVLKRIEGRHSEHLTAYVVLADGAEIADVRTSLAQQLPAQMVPSQFVSREALPLTANGKIDRKLLSRLDDIAAETAEGEPETVTERTLMAIESEVLRRERIGLDRRFFEIGGDSLRAIRVLAKARARFDVQLQLEDLFAYPTIRQLAAYIDTLEPKSAATIPAAVGGPGEYPLAPAQALLLDVERRYLPAQRSAFNRNDRFDIDGPLDSERLATAFRLLAERHESLRTTFDANRDLQVIHPTGGITPEWQAHDLTAVENQQAELDRRIRGRLATPFDVRTQSLVRADLFTLGAERHVLLTSMHQLISDATSAGVMHEELQRGYEDVVLGRGSTLPPLDLQYKEAAAQRRSRLDERRAELADFWYSRLAGAAPRIELRGAKPRPRVASLAGERMVRTVSPALADGIGALARANGVTEFVVAEAAIGSLLLTESGQQDIIIGTYSAGRGDSASESQIGCYINAIPLRFRSTREPMEALLRRTQQELLDAMRHEGYPYGAILADLGWQRGIESTPLFDVMIAYDDGEGQDTASTVAGATFEVRSLPRRAKEGDLHIAFVRWPDRLELAMTYGSDRFDSDAVAALLDRLVDMLAMMVADASPATAAGPEYSATEEAFRG